MHGSILCATCRREYAIEDVRWRCDCGGLLDWHEASIFDRASVATGDASLWRYAAWLPDFPPVTLGEGWTPLLPADWCGRRVWFKADHQNPTGSYKDRGATVQVSRLAALGVRELVEDSSGNAGSALAIYAAKANLQASIFTPAGAPAAKLRMIREAGAELVTVPGGRDEVTRAVRAAAETRFYASHVWDPLYLLGTRTAAYEIAEQLGWQAPAMVITPVGNGAVLLGLAMGFEHLRRSGVIDRLPRLLGVQAAACAPLARAWEQGLTEPVAVTPGPTAAGGVVVPAPARGAQVIAAARATGGEICAVGEGELQATREALARSGWYLEPTGALGAAALATVLDQTTRCEASGGEVVVMLTGHGLKGA